MAQQLQVLVPGRCFQQEEVAFATLELCPSWGMRPGKGLWRGGETMEA